MEWYEYLNNTEGLSISIYGEDKLMRINYTRFGYENEMVVSLDTYRIISHVTRPTVFAGQMFKSVVPFSI